MNRDLYNNLKIDIGIAPIAVTSATASAVGTGSDTQGFDKFVLTGEMGTNGTGTMKVQESAALGSGYTDAAAADVQGTQGESLVQDDVIKLGYIGSKRYARAHMTVTVGTDGVSSLSLKGGASQKKVD